MNEYKLKEAERGKKGELVVVEGKELIISNFITNITNIPVKEID